jgi:hypothetical protein
MSEDLEFEMLTGPPPLSQIELVTLVVRSYDAAIRFFVDCLGFELVGR